MSGSRGFGSVVANDRKDSLREDELFDLYKLSSEAKNDWTTIRLLDHDLLPIKKHWISIQNKEGKEIRIPKMCVSFDPDSDKPLRDMQCPFCKVPHRNKDNPDAPAQLDIKYLCLAIIRDLQDSRPAKLPKLSKTEEKTGYKERGSKAWTPVRVVPMTKGNVIRINELAERNLHKDPEGKGKKAYPLNHPVFGCDVEIKFKDGKGVAPADRYQIEKGDVAKLSKEEKGYLIYDLSNWEEIYDKLGRLDEEAALKDYKKMDVVGMAPEEDDEEDEERGASLGRKKKDNDDDKKSKKSRMLDEDDEDEDDEDDRPKKKKTSKLLGGKKSKKSKDEDDEDEKPKKKKSKKSKDDEDEKPKKKKKKSSDEDDAPKKKKKKK